MTKDLLRRVVTVLVTAMAIVTFSAHAALKSELDILDLTANSGINPQTGNAWEAGDQYRLIFVSSGTTNAVSLDLSTYDSFLQDLADTEGIGGTWKVIGSTGSVDAKDHTSTNPSSTTGVAVFLMNGSTSIADNNSDLWDGYLDAKVNIDEQGNTGLTVEPFTGTSSNGTKRDRHLGGSDETPARVTYGSTDKTDSKWTAIYHTTATTARPYYALSDLLTVQDTTTTISGTTGGDDTWNTSGNWDNGIPSGDNDVVVAASVAATVDNASTPSYTGTLTLESNASLTINDSVASAGALTNADAVTLKSGAAVYINADDDITIAPITLEGDATLESIYPTSDHETTNISATTGAYTLTLIGFNNHTFNLNATNTFSELVSDATDRHNVRAKAAGALGTGNVTIAGRVSDNRSAQLYLDVASTISDTATLTLNGYGFDAATSDCVTIASGVDERVGALVVDGTTMAIGVYDNTEAWLSGSGTLIVGANTAPVAATQAVSVDAYDSVAITLTATDAHGDDLTYSVVTQPTYGTLTGTAPNLTYTPDTGCTGSDSFTFKANDGEYDSDPAVISITIDAVTITDHIWDGGGADSNWSTPANWQNDVVPSVDDNARFDGTSSKNCTIDTDVNVASIEIQDAYSGVVSGGSATVSLNAGNFEVEIFATPSRFTCGTSTFKFIGNASSQTIKYRPDETLYNVENAKSGGTLYFSSVRAITINRLTLNAGTTTNLGLSEITLAELDMDGTDGNLATLINAGIDLSSPATVTYASFTDVDASAGNTIYAGPTSVDVARNLNIQFISYGVWSGLGADNNFSTVGNWTGGVVPATTQAVLFSSVGTKNCTIDSSITVGGISVESGYTGTINAGSYTVTVTGNITIAGGTFTASSATIDIAGSDAQNITFGSASLDDIDVSNTSGFVLFKDAFSVDTLTLDGGSAMEFKAGSTYTIATLSADGAGSVIYLRSSVTDTAYNFDITGSAPTVKYVSVMDSDASAGYTIDATDNGSDEGNNTNWTFENQATTATVAFLPEEAGFYTTLDITVSSTPADDMTIHYTTDGTTPTKASATYTGAFTISDNAEVKAITVYDEGGANEEISQVFGKHHYKVTDLVDCYPRKSYGLNAGLFVGDSRKFGGQVWWVGPDGEFDEMEGDDVLVPELEESINWSCTGGTITSDGVFTDDGLSETAYTVTLTIGGNSYTGCNNWTATWSARMACECDTSGKENLCDGEDAEECEDCEDKGNASTSPSASASNPATNSGEEKYSTYAAAYSAVQEITSAGITAVESPCGDTPCCKNEVLGKCKPKDTQWTYSITENSPQYIRTNKGIPVTIHSKPYAGSYALKDYSFGRCNGKTMAGKIQVIDSTRLLVHQVDGLAKSKFTKSGDTWYGSSDVKAFSGSIELVDDQYVFTNTDGLVFTYTASSPYRIESIADPAGNAVQYTYNNNDMDIVDASGNKYHLDCDTEVDNKKLVSLITVSPVNSQASRSWAYAYDEDGFMTKETFVEKSSSVSFAYDTFGNRTKQTDEAGYSETFAMDSAWNTTKVTDREGNQSLVTNTLPHAANATKTKADKLGNTTTIKYNGYWLPREITKPNGKVESFDYNSSRVRTKRTVAVSEDTNDDIVETYEYDSSLNITRTVYDGAGLNLSKKLFYDSKSRITKEENARGIATVTYYDTKHRVTKAVFDPTGLNITKVRKVYDTEGKLTKHIDAKDSETVYVYDSRNLMTRVIKPQGESIRYAYDDWGNRTLTKDPNGKDTQYFYNADNKLTKKTDPRQKDTLYFRDEKGKVTKKRNKNDKDTTYEYDKNGRATKVGGDAAGCSSCGGSDSCPAGDSDLNAEGNIDKYTDNNGKETKYGYDEENRVTSKTKDYGASNITTYTEYDKHGLVKMRTNAEGVETTISYDKAKRRTKVSRELGATTLNTTYAYNTTGKVTSTTDENNNTTGIFYDNADRRTRVVDANGVVTEYDYDKLDNVTSVVVDPSGLNIITLSFYDANSRVTKMTNAENESTTYEYDNNGNRTKASDPNAHSTLYFYDDANNMTQMTDALNNSTTYEYDGKGNRTKVTNALSVITTYEYSSTDKVTRTVQDGTLVSLFVYDPVGNLTRTEVGEDGIGERLATEYYYDNLNRRTSTIVDPSEAAITAGVYYSDAGNVTKTVDALGNTTVTYYDDQGRRIRFVDTGLIPTTFDYDSNGNVTKVNQDQTVLSIDTLSFFDPVNRLTKTQDDQGNITTFVYDNSGRRVSVTDDNNHTSSTAYDKAGRVTKSTNAESESVQYFYDDAGRRITTVQANGLVRTLTYDDVNRVTLTTIDPDTEALSTQMFYDALGRNITRIDPAGKHTVYEYDNLSRLTAMSDDADGNGEDIDTSYYYNLLGNLTKIEDDKDQATTYEYDTVNRLTKEVYADSGEKTYAYDDGGKVTQLNDQNGNQITSIYDDSSRLVTKTVNDTVEQVFSYDNISRMTKAIDYNSSAVTVTTEWGYDKISRVTKETQTVGARTTHNVISAYDGVGPRTTLTYPGGTALAYTYDDANRLTNINDGSNVAGYTYDASGLVTGKTLGATGVSLGVTLDSAKRITKYDWQKSSNTVIGFSYGLDDAGNKQYEEKLHDTSHSQYYYYDGVYRLTSYDEGTLTGTDGNRSAPTTVSYYQNYMLDGVGNWTRFYDNTATPEYRQHTATNEMEYRGTSTPTQSANYTYDNNGNMTTDLLFTYSYDALNRLVEVKRTTDSVVVGDYAYDALNRRVYREADEDGDGTAETELYYVYDGSRVIEERDYSAQTVTREYIYGLYVDEPISITEGEDTFYYVTNNQYSVHGLVNTSGTLVEENRYTPYGTQTAVTDDANVKNLYTYTGRRSDSESGLMYYRARMYSVVMGRFVQRDPLGYVDGMNLYEYVKGNPMYWLDPWGTIKLKDFKKEWKKKGGDDLVDMETFEDIYKSLVERDETSADKTAKKALDFLEGKLDGVIESAGSAALPLTAAKAILGTGISLLKVAMPIMDKSNSCKICASELTAHQDGSQYWVAKEKYSVFIFSALFAGEGNLLGVTKIDFQPRCNTVCGLWATRLKDKKERWIRCSQ